EDTGLYLKFQDGVNLTLTILLTSTAIVYAAGLLMRRWSRYDKYVLGISITANLGLILVFKYAGFISVNLQALSGYLHISHPIGEVKLLMPIGISFYIFKSVSYIIDVYRKKIEPQRHFGIFALYVSFFPQLLAGPIERSTTFLPQVTKQFSYDYQRITDGLKIMAWGFFKKLVIADRLALYVDKVFASPASIEGLSLLLAAYFFTIQIYCDFSGYSDIAIGSAKILGYEGMDNFRRPYFSKTMQEFWSRWHISLSTWFRDYLYIPLGGNRVSAARRYFNVMAVFLLSGLWHGANWTFVVWGGVHGAFLLFSHATMPVRTRLKQGIFRIIGAEKNGTIKAAADSIMSLWSIIVTFNLAAFAWIFFKADSLTKAADFIKNMFKWNLGNIMVGFSFYDFLLMILSILMLVLLDFIQEHDKCRHPFTQKKDLMRWGLYYVVVLSIVFFGVFEQSKFIYFNF
ncbi:MAG TPA: MBOAT family O-acyltransferase, partial [Spirochaetota bacterium]|nr:MBOAT family O-acyltransferase [Spirochaetota bacterium]